MGTKSINDWMERKKNGQIEKRGKNNTGKTIHERNEVVVVADVVVDGVSVVVDVVVDGVNVVVVDVEVGDVVVDGVSVVVDVVEVGVV